MDELLPLEVDFNYCWSAPGSSGGWMFYEPKRVTLGQHVLAVDLYDATLTAAATVVRISEYVAFLSPTTILPAETESSL